MPHNFLILYDSREGSSAIVQKLSKIDGIAVPVFEELDAYWIRKFQPRDDIVQELDRVFTERRYRHDTDYGLRNSIVVHPDPDRAESVGFKWRPHGNPVAVRDVLRKHDVMVFALFRRDLIEITSSYYLTKTLHKSHGSLTGRMHHLQFKLAKMGDEERRQAKKIIDGTEVPLNLPLFFLYMGHRVWKVFRTRLFLIWLRWNGLRTDVVHYEDFRDDSDRFMNDFLDRIDIASRGQRQGEPRGRLEKTSSRAPQERIRNFWMVRYNPLTWGLVALYWPLMRKPARSPD